MALRQSEGLIGSIKRMLNIGLPVPDHTALSRRGSGLPIYDQGRIGADELHLIVEGTGLKLRGAGEWPFEKHGTAKRRSWRKLHIGIDADSGEIVAFDLTDKEVDDALCMSRPYWINWPAHQFHSWATGLITKLAFSRASWREIRTLNSSCLPAKERDWANGRDIASPARPTCSRGRCARRMNWQKTSGYNRRSKVEAPIQSLQAVIGDTLKSREDARRVTEVVIAIK